MPGYEHTCYRISEGKCEGWKDARRFEEVCSVDYGRGCINRPGPLGGASTEEQFKEDISGMPTPAKTIAPSKPSETKQTVNIFSL